MLSNLPISYADKVTTLESAFAVLSPGSEGREMLQNNAISLRDEDEKLNSEISEMVRRLESAGASQEEFRSRISSPKGADMTRQDEIKPLRKEPVEVKHPQGS